MGRIRPKLRRTPHPVRTYFSHTPLGARLGGASVHPHIRLELGRSVRTGHGHQRCPSAPAPSSPDGNENAWAEHQFSSSPPATASLAGSPSKPMTASRARNSRPSELVTRAPSPPLRLRHLSDPRQARSTDGRATTSSELAWKRLPPVDRRNPPTTPRQPSLRDGSTRR